VVPAVDLLKMRSEGWPWELLSAPGRNSPSRKMEPDKRQSALNENFSSNQIVDAGSQGLATDDHR